MKKQLFLSILTFSILFMYGVRVNGQIIYSEDFESYGTGNITTVIASYPHFINNNAGLCAVADGWRVSTDGLFVGDPTQCLGCVNKYAEIEYDDVWGCSQLAELVLGSFTPATSSILIQFDYSYLDWSSRDDFTVTLYNKTTATTAATLLGPLTSSTNGTYSGFETVTAGQTYELRFLYDGEDDLGAAVDNVLVQELCGPSFTYTQTCNGSLNIDLSVTISALNGAPSAVIKTGSKTYKTGIGVGTHNVNNIDTAAVWIGSSTNPSCGVWIKMKGCEPCNTNSTPADLCVNAPLVNLSQPFFGSTECTYTITNDGVGIDPNGPDAFCGSIENDSWMKFIASDDSIILGWKVTGGGACVTGVQFAIFDGNCSNYDAMTMLGCHNPTAGTGIGDTGNFVVGGLTVGQTYYYYIDGFAGDQCQYKLVPLQGISFLPECDTCLTSCSISCGGSDSADIIQATASDAPIGCSSGGTPGKGVWYQVVGDGSKFTISTDNAGTNFDTQLNVYTGSCGALSCLTGDDDSGSGTTSEVTFNTTNGVTYYIYVDGDGAAEGSFVISLTCEPCDADAGGWN